MKKITTLLFTLLIAVIGLSQNTGTVKHFLTVQVSPGSSQLMVLDSVVMPEGSEYTFSLNANLVPVEFSKNIKLKKIESDVNAGDIGMDRDDAGSDDAGLKINKWKVSFKDETNSFTISYSGEIASAIKQSEENYQRGFSESPGIISNLGVYLAGSTFWVPTFENNLMTFDMTAVFPDGWKTVSQGERVKEFIDSGKHIDEWLCDKPQEEVFLIAAQFNEYSYRMNNGVMAMAFLRTPDEGLSSKYLEVTEQYMNMYEELIGKYPYSKFALVENFWETGYGMPSFTLLGEKIIRFPFILHSSYPHELLHNWWGNSVYVDFSKGNWCEGITAYEADHLIKEQRGRGEDYRRSTLKKFTDFVNPGNDFPIRRFASRYDGPSEAIGYGKALMMWHMVRRKLGDENFKKGMSLFNENFKYKFASFGDICSSLEEVSGTDLKPFFHQWIDRTGAPALSIKEIKTDTYNDKFRVFLTLEQIQDSAAFDIDIPVAIATQKGVEHFTINMYKKEQDFQFTLNSKPGKLVVDPQFDVFRTLAPSEVPPALSKIWASEQNIFILPHNADANNSKMYNELADKWKAADNDSFEIVYDDEIEKLAKEYGNKETAEELVEEDHSLVWFYIPKNARWSEIFKQSTKQGEFLTDAVRAITRENPKLQGVIDIKDFNETASGQRVVSDDKLKALIDVLNKHRLGLKDVEPDILGRAYEYLLRKFAEGSGQSAGEFYTPREVAVLMANIVNPKEGEEIYDPCLGSGGLLIKSYLRFKGKSWNFKSFLCSSS